MTPPEYPYPPGKITTRQAVEFIAAVVYPGDNLVASRKRVRARIDYARKKAILSAADTFEPDTFFRWAIDANPDWADALVLVKGMPRAAIMMGGVSVASSSSCICSPTVIPGDPDRLREAYCQAESERLNLLEENIAMKQRTADLEAEVNAWRDKGLKLSEKLSRSGKKGGRGNESTT
jgi:hypothetical protein